MYISYEDFDRVDLRSGVVTKVEPFPGPRNQLIKYGFILALKLA